MMLIFSPLSKDQMREMVDVDFYVTVTVEMDLEDAIDNDHEGWLDILSSAVTGDELLMDISYKVVGIIGETLLIQVSGDVFECLEEEEEEEEDQ
jgi:hypothetical protein